MIGWLYFVSAVLLTGVVAVVYSAAQEAYAPARLVFRRALKRAGKLGGVLLALGILVHFLSTL